MAKFELIKARQRLSKALEDYLIECGIDIESAEVYQHELNAIIDFASAYLLGTLLSIEGLNEKSLLDYFTYTVRKHVHTSLDAHRSQTIY